MLIRALPMKIRNRLARDVINTFATHAYLVHDVTAVWAQNGSTHRCDFASFNRLNKQDQKSSEELPCALLYSTLGVLFRNTRLRRKTGRYGRIDSRESSHGAPSILTFGHLTYLNIRRVDCVLFLTAVSLISSILTLSKTDAFYSLSKANTCQHCCGDAV